MVNAGQPRGEASYDSGRLTTPGGVAGTPEKKPPGCRDYPGRIRGRNLKFCGPKITAGLERQPTESRQLVDFNQRFAHAAVSAGNLDRVATSTQARGGRLTSETQKVSARSSAAPTGTLDQMPRNAAKYIIGAGGRSVALLHCDGVGSFAAAAGVLLLGQLWGILATVS